MALVPSAAAYNALAPAVSTGLSVLPQAAGQIITAAQAGRAAGSLSKEIIKAVVRQARKSRAKHTMKTKARTPKRTKDVGEDPKQAPAKVFQISKAGLEDQDSRSFGYDDPLKILRKDNTTSGDDLNRCH